MHDEMSEQMFLATRKAYDLAHRAKDTQSLVVLFCAFVGAVVECPGNDALDYLTAAETAAGRQGLLIDAD